MVAILTERDRLLTGPRD